jgi:hypothetical protein
MHLLVGVAMPTIEAGGEDAAVETTTFDVMKQSYPINA